MRSLSGKRYLAPLTTVGNLPFRRLCVELGAEITCGEMAIFGVQLAGGYPDTLTKAAQAITENFEVDFVDLNLGCPIDVVNEKGGGCSLANKSSKLLQVVRAMQAVIGDTPLTIKMRYGLKEGERTSHLTMKRIVDECPPQMITLHPRSKEQRYTKLAEWDYVPQCLEAIDKKRLEESKVDGIMIGRGALIKPWLFTEIEERRDWDISATERLDLIQKYVNYGLEYWGSDDTGVECTRRFLLEWMSFTHRYVPLGLLERLPARMNEKPPPFVGRNDLETLLASKRASDWIKVTEMAEMAHFHDEVEIEDFEFDEEKQLYHYPCPCGDRFEITLEMLRAGEDVATCPSCSLLVRVIYDMEQYVELETITDSRVGVTN
ncbi:TRNA-dihydrouridine(47) synthase [NAD(P)(+)] [Aphelenchoides fujianensis]|nr:TRNA-dihydrouridine(47) synthase [NAD(P)(+)] [Aphelenchoides fujianensis]